MSYADRTPYRNVVAMLQERNIPILDFCKMMRFSLGAFYSKMAARTDWKLEECMRAKLLLCYTGPIEELFRAYQPSGGDTEAR